MQIHKLTQGSPEWIAYRTQHFNASDAPAMLGCSPYKTRSQLLHELATGQSAEVDAGTQRRFDDGHRFEALARPIAEEIMGEDLYPVVGSDGELSASFDGLTMAETRSAEHKSLNDEIRAALPHQGRDSHLNNDATKLGKVYRVQMEQQLMVSKAEENLFSATKWEDDKLVEERHAWYRSDPALRTEILAGWAQFKQDLAAYVPPEVIVAPVAEPQMGLPAVVIKVEGSIALVDNLPAIGVALNAYIAGINKKPESDQDFANLEATVKHLKAFEEALGASEENALAQVGSVDAMRKTVALYRELASSNRLLVDKLVKAEKENRRTAIVGDAVAELVTHVKKLNERLRKPYMPSIAGDFQGVIKGLKSLDSMKDKVAGELARCKIAANEAADRIQANLATLRELASEHAFLFADTAQLVGKANDDLTALVKSRIADHKAAEAAKEEATRERIRAEEQSKAEREHAAKVESERIQREKAEQAQAARIREEQAVPVNQPGPSTASVPFEAVVAMMPAAVRQAIATKPETPPSLKLGQIAERLGFTLTADFLKVLGYEPAATDRASKLYHEEDFPAICQALIAHVAEVSEQFEKVAA